MDLYIAQSNTLLGLQFHCTTFKHAFSLASLSVMFSILIIIDNGDNDTYNHTDLDSSVCPSIGSAVCMSSPLKPLSSTL